MRSTPFGERSHEVITDSKDAFRMIERDPPRFGQYHRSAGTLEKQMTQTFLQLANLGGQRGLGQVQQGGGTGQVALSGNLLKVAQVVIVEPHIVLLIRTFPSIQCIFI
ncbi:hypothetical protein A3728_12730 [Sulfitobacter sp. HI0040]|nr:hypothetical protein A3728_12730 [Sulfitobacter sp. HI0040]